MRRAILLALALGGCNAAFGLEETELVPPDLDRDDDQVLDSVDNCPDVPNEDQANGDGDALGDACDACPGRPSINHDEDLDGRDDACDGCPGLDDFDVDRDGDGIGDGCDNTWTTRVVFDPFVELAATRWQTAVAWNTDDADAVGPTDPLPPGDDGLALVPALPTSAVRVDIGVIAGQHWAVGEHAGVVVRGASSTISCTLGCAIDGCKLTLSSNGSAFDSPLAPVPFITLSLQIVATSATTASVVCIATGSTRTAIGGTVAGSASVNLVASPGLRLTYVDVLQ